MKEGKWKRELELCKKTWGGGVNEKLIKEEEKGKK